ncbi:uncharacterized protein LOC125260317 isoform X2 [Megalobrama amblycephala]|uniref:uncharacterized protein LOC125260317 isoform X2 n=1 Tax=Megalobrama amblycephala TaxID=75352 RepID=UPI002013D8FD|nr:uncharacterized protein LOC125260317 isoform X2 [Megalobrama amblycephala]
MSTRWVILHIFAVLLLCDYGMFSTPSPSPSSTERTTTETSNTSHSNTTVTMAESTTIGNDTDPDTPDEESSGLMPTNSSYEDTTETDDSDDSNVIPSTARPESTTHKQNPPLEKKKDSDSGSYTGGIIILIIILILIFFLLGILYFLRKKGRSYSFDLTRVDAIPNDYDTPLRSDQQGISYEQTNKDLCLDYEQEDKSEEKTSPIANGCTGEKTEQTPASENDQENVPEENSFSTDSSLSPPMKKVEFNLDLDLIGGESDLNDLTTADAADEPQNENNNNVSNSGQ